MVRKMAMDFKIHLQWCPRSMLLLKIYMVPSLSPLMLTLHYHSNPNPHPLLPSRTPNPSLLTPCVSDLIVLTHTLALALAPTLTRALTATLTPSVTPTFAFTLALALTLNLNLTQTPGAILVRPVRPHLHSHPYPHSYPHPQCHSYSNP